MRTWLKELREKNQLTQQAIASKVGMSLSNFNLIENGERQKDLDLSLVLKLSKIFDVSIDYIADEEIKLKNDSDKSA